MPSLPVCLPNSSLSPCVPDLNLNNNLVPASPTPRRYFLNSTILPYSTSDGMNFSLDSDSQYTLTCISTGGPATTVTWTRYSATVTEGTETVLDDPVTAQYTHTLTVTATVTVTVTWRAEGRYACTVANDVSETSTELDVKGKTECCLCYILAFLCSSSLHSS